MKSIIVNADDFGFDEHTVDWTIKGFESGKLSSATIMAGFAGTKRAVDYAKAHPQFSFGVHIFFSDETPISNPDTIPTLVDPATGKLWVTRQFILRSLTGRIAKEDLKREIRAQVNAIQAMGLKITHVDGHGHLHRLPLSLQALIELKDELGIVTTRRTQDIYFVKPGLGGRLLNWSMQKKLGRHFKSADHFLMTAGKTQDPKWFEKSLAILPEGITEIGIHPGAEPEWRKIDTENVFGTELPAGIELINFNVLRS